MVGYAFAAQFPARVTRWVIIDAPLPGIGPWDEIIRSPALWHFNFRGPDVERLVKGRERCALLGTTVSMDYSPTKSSILTIVIPNDPTKYEFRGDFNSILKRLCSF